MTNSKSTYVLLTWLLLLSSPLPLWADGWHNVALTTGSLDEWLRDVKAVIPDIQDHLGSSQLEAGSSLEDLKRRAEQAGHSSDADPGGSRAGRLQAQLTPQQQALLGRKAGNCLEVLAYMDPKNIIPREFPKFQLRQHGQYRSAAKELLGLMGPTGGEAVAGQLRSELMGAGCLAARRRDLAPHDHYVKDLLEVLQQSAHSGHVSDQDLEALRQAVDGQKRGPGAELAAHVERVLDEIDAGDLLTLSQRIQEGGDRVRKLRLQKKLREQVKAAAVADLLEALEHEELESSVRRAVREELAQRMSEAGLPELLQTFHSDQADAVLQRAAAAGLKRRLAEASVLELLEIADDGALDGRVRQAAAEELASQRPPYGDVQEQILAIWQFASSQHPQVSRAARWQIAHAFQQAPISHCLYWLGEGEEAMAMAIWKQLQRRLEQATGPQRNDYRELALRVLKLDDANLMASRRAALELLGRLNDPQAVGPVLDLLPQLPRELWPPAGSLLRDLTGQDFGPRPGDGVAEVGVALKRWRAWWAKQGGQATKP